MVRSLMRPPPEVVEYYTRFAEESRLTLGSSQLEFERTKDLISRFLLQRPAEIIDVGGAAGAYAFWLAGLDYRVHLVDVTPRLIDEARRRNAAAAHPLASIAVSDARQLPMIDSSVDAVLLLGPQYHLPERGERLAALQEARRVLRPGGLIFVAAISRYAGTLDSIALNPALDPRVVEMRQAAVADGQYRNRTDNPRYFVTAYFHRPEDLVEELAASNYRDIRVFGVEGPGWLLPDFDTRWKDACSRNALLSVARLLEEELSILGMSAHLLAVGGKP